jgi:N-alpha-acetyltransferase 15/16, NatA auxiliary subunit
MSGLTKGIPSLFADLKSLYDDKKKCEVIEDIVEGARKQFEPVTPSTRDPSEPDEPDEPPTTYLWTLYYLAQHHSALSRPARALSMVELALVHTPTLPELYTCKARILKRAGDRIGAARCLDEARVLDGQDRFLNTKCAKYRFRAGMVEQAVEVLGLFTKVCIRDS